MGFQNGANGAAKPREVIQDVIVARRLATNTAGGGLGLITGESV